MMLRFFVNPGDRGDVLTGLVRTVAVGLVALGTGGWIAVQAVAKEAPQAAETLRVWGGIIGLITTVFGGICALLAAIVYARALAKTKALLAAEKTVEIYKEQIDAWERQTTDTKAQYERVVTALSTKDAELKALREKTDLTKILDMMGGAMTAGDKKYAQVTDSLTKILELIHLQGKESLTATHANFGLLEKVVESLGALQRKMGAVERKQGDLKNTLDAVADQAGVAAGEDDGEDRRQNSR